MENSNLKQGKFEYCSNVKGLAFCDVSPELLGGSCPYAGGSLVCYEKVLWENKFATCYGYCIG